MSSRPGAIKRLWWRWKTLRLPWRKRWLVGFDLAGNTFWEFKDAIHAGKVRRIVSYATNAHYGDVKLTPPWVQWLRHMRFEPPTINEQQLDEIRQAQMKELAARADARWAAKPSALDVRAAQPQLLNSIPRRESTQQDVGYQARVQEQQQEVVGEAVKDVVQEAPSEAQEGVQRTTTQETSSQQPEAHPAKVKEFKGYRLANEGEQQPSSWAPKAAKRR